MNWPFKWTLYRWLMKLAHRYNWHYAPRIGPFEDGTYQMWCKWCGLRQAVASGKSIEIGNFDVGPTVDHEIKWTCNDPPEGGKLIVYENKHGE